MTSVSANCRLHPLQYQYFTDLGSRPMIAPQRLHVALSLWIVGLLGALRSTGLGWGCESLRDRRAALGFRTSGSGIVGKFAALFHLIVLHLAQRFGSVPLGSQRWPQMSHWYTSPCVSMS